MGCSLTFSKGLTKLAIILDYKRLCMLCPAFQPGPKIGPDFSRKLVLKLKLPKSHFNKKFAPKILFLNLKKSERFE